MLKWSAALLVGGLLYGQSPGPVFEATSVKHLGNAAAVMVGPGTSPGVTRACRYEDTKVTCRQPLLALMQEAYGVHSWQVQGPDWIDAEIYEVAATMPAGTTRETARLMMRAMLADRLGLKLRTDQKEFAIYALTPTKGGPKLTEIEKPARFSYGIVAGNGEDTLRFEGKPGIPMAAFVVYLQGPAGRPVIDETGLKGYYAFDLEWTRAPEDRKNAGILSTLGKVGLKLEPQKKLYDVLVIEKASREPTEN